MPPAPARGERPHSEDRPQAEGHGSAQVFEGTQHSTTVDPLHGTDPPQECCPSLQTWQLGCSLGSDGAVQRTKPSPCSHLGLLQWCQLQAECLAVLSPAQCLWAAAASCRALSTAKVELADIRLVLLQHRLQQAAAAAAALCGVHTVSSVDGGWHRRLLLLGSEELANLRGGKAQDGSRCM